MRLGNARHRQIGAAQAALRTQQPSRLARQLADTGGAGASALQQLAALAPRRHLLISHRAPLPPPFLNLAWPLLTAQETEQLLFDSLKGAAPSDASSWLYARTLGHPLLTAEYIQYLRRQGYLWSDGQTWRWRLPPSHFLPPTIEVLVQDWLSPLPLGSAARHLLESAALLPEGSSWPPTTRAALWSALAGQDLAPLQAELEDLGVLRRGTLEFAHPLLRRGLLEGLPQSQRLALARRTLGLLIEAQVEPSTDLIAEARLGSPQTLNIYVRLAEQARASGQSSSAGQWLALASEHAEAGQQPQLALEAAQLLRHHDVEQALALAQRAASTQPFQHAALMLCAELALEQGNHQEAENWLGLLAERYAEGETPADGPRQVWELRLKLLYGTYERHAEALDLWNAHPHWHAGANPETVLQISSIFGQRGAFDAASELSRPLLNGPPLDPFLRCRVLEFQATLHFLQNQTGLAERYGFEALALARSLERPSYLAKLLRKQFIFVETLGRLAEAKSYLGEALELYRQHGPELDLAHIQASYGKLLYALGEFEEAETDLLESFRTLTELDNKLLSCDAALGLCGLYVEWQPSYGGTLALKYAHVAWELANTVENQQLQHTALFYLAQTEALFGDPKAALGYAQQSQHEQFTGPSERRRARSQVALGLA